MDTSLFTGLPDKRYSTLVVDPPWSYNDKLGGGNTGFGESKTRQKTGMYPGVRAAANHYGTLTVEEIATLPVPDLAEDNAHLYVWVTNAFMPDAYELIKRWGFKAKTLVTWVKTKKGVEVPESPEDCAFGMGFYYRNMTEHAVFAVRGSLKPESHSVRNVAFGPDNVVYAPLGAHSEKPDEAYRVFASLSPGPRLDMFARKPREGFEVWGNQVESAEISGSVDES